MTGAGAQSWLFRQDAYASSAPARVLGQSAEGGLLLDAVLFYAQGGGQPGDSGLITWAGGRLAIANAVKAGGQIALVPAAPGPLPPPGTLVQQRLDWDRRHRHMRMHSALHLLSVVLPFPVTGGQIGADKGRLDFDLPDPPEDLAAVEAALSALIERDLKISEEWISEAELAAQPQLVKTLRVAPPQGQGPVRLVRIGEGAATIDLQPCGGTHVARTGEIGAVKITKIEKKGRENRRVTLAFDGPGLNPVG